MTTEKTVKEKMMKKNVWTPLQITWLVLAIFVAQNSILALNSDDHYCSGAYCEKDNDCGAPCSCSAQSNVCYYLIERAR
jgi:hypothetical protein